MTQNARQSDHMWIANETHVLYITYKLCLRLFTILA